MFLADKLQSPHYISFLFLFFLSDVVFEKAYCEYRLNRVESALKTIEGAPEQTDKLKELYGQVVRLSDHQGNHILAGCFTDTFYGYEDSVPAHPLLITESCGL